MTRPKQRRVTTSKSSEAAALHLAVRGLVALILSTRWACSASLLKRHGDSCEHCNSNHNCLQHDLLPVPNRAATLPPRRGSMMVRCQRITSVSSHRVERIQSSAFELCSCWGFRTDLGGGAAVIFFTTLLVLVTG